MVEQNRWGDAPVPDYWRYDDDHALWIGPGRLTAIDLATSTGTMFVEEQIVREAGLEHFARALVQGSILMLPTRRDRHPIHAAALQRGDRGLVLHGPSGAGKSTLCYIASQAGIDILADDAIRVQRAPALRVWGGETGGGRCTRHVHVREDVRERFAVLRENPLLGLRTTGVLKYIVPLAVDDPRPSRPPYVSRTRVCLLDRERGPVRCERVSAEEIVRTIVSAPESRGDMYPLGRPRAAEAIAAGGGWRLRLSNDPEEALPFLIEMLEQV